MDFNSLTLREKIGQTMILLCKPGKHIEQFGSLEKFLKKYPIGGLFPCAEVEKGVMKGVDYEKFNHSIDEYNKYLKVPLVVASDVVQRNTTKINFESNMSIGAANDVALAYDYGKVIGNRVGELGIDWVFYPEIDLNMCADSPITNVRSISDDPERLIPLANAVIKGIQDSGIAACAKHYPGTDDNERIDPHLAPINNSISKEKWEKTNGKVYEAVSSNGVMSIMSAHINLPSMQTYKIDDTFPPATKSEELICGLLKERIGFKGVVVTDALIMGGFVGKNGVYDQVESLKSGNDVLLWPDIHYMDVLEKKIISGEFPIERLDNAVKRILDLKKKLGLFEAKKKDIVFDKHFESRVLEEIAKKSITVIQDYNKVIPIDKNIVKNILVVAVTPDEMCYEDLCKVQDVFSQYGINVDIKRDIWLDDIEENKDKYDFTIFALCRLPHRPIGPLDFWGENASSIWASQATDKEKTLVVSFGSPYMYKYYRETKMTYVNAYSPSYSTVEAFVKGVLGEFEFTGTSPVKLI